MFAGPPLVALATFAVLLCAGSVRSQSAFNVTAYLNHPYYELDVGNATHGTWEDIISPGTGGIPLDMNALGDDGFVSVALNWTFPFYGHPHTNITISANGFLSFYPTSCVFFCPWQIQYYGSSPGYARFIAPLMTDFNPGQYSSSGSKVVYRLDTVLKQGKVINRMTVTYWKMMLYQPSIPFVPPFNDAETFSFQVLIDEDGDVLFKYYQLPFNPASRKIKAGGSSVDRAYPVFIGVQDSAVLERPGDVTLVTTYRPVLFDYNITNNLTTVALDALPTCISQTTCNGCIAFSVQQDLSACVWCPEIDVCTDGQGRELYEVQNACPTAGDFSVSTCTLSTEQKISLVAAVLIGVAGTLVLVGLLWWFYLRRVRKREAEEAAKAERQIAERRAELDAPKPAFGEEDEKTDEYSDTGVKATRATQGSDLDGVHVDMRTHTGGAVALLPLHDTASSSGHGETGPRYEQVHLEAPAGGEETERDFASRGSSTPTPGD